MNQTSYQTPTRVLALASQPLSSPQGFSDEQAPLSLMDCLMSSEGGEYLNQTSILDRQFNSVQLKSAIPKAPADTTHQVLQNYITSKQAPKATKKVTPRQRHFEPIQLKSPSSQSSMGYGSATFSPPVVQKARKAKPLPQLNSSKSPKKVESPCKASRLTSQQLINMGFPTQQRRLSSQVAIIPECTNSH